MIYEKCHLNKHVMCIPWRFNCLSCTAHLGCEWTAGGPSWCRWTDSSTAPWLTDNAGIQSWGLVYLNLKPLSGTRGPWTQKRLSNWPKLAMWTGTVPFAVMNEASEWPVLSVTSWVAPISSDRTEVAEQRRIWIVWHQQVMEVDVLCKLYQQGFVNHCALSTNWWIDKGQNISDASYLIDAKRLHCNFFVTKLCNSK